MAGDDRSREFSSKLKTNRQGTVENAAEWWKKDVMEVLEEFVRTGGAPNVSDAYTINGQPGDLYPCSKSGMFS